LAPSFPEFVYTAKASVLIGFRFKCAKCTHNFYLHTNLKFNQAITLEDASGKGLPHIQATDSGQIMY
jgi:hypothetical protein